MSTKLRTHGKGVVVWILLAVMVLGLGGFGVSSFTGGGQSVASVGDSEITVNDYARALRQQMNTAQQQIGRPLTMAEARTFGIDRQVQGQLLLDAALSEEASRLGLSIGDTEVARQITQAQAFQGITGSFDRETYRMALRQQGFTEGEFETRVRNDIARSLFQGVIAAGAPAPAALTDAYVGYITETRPLAWAEIADADLAETPAAPTEDQLQAFYAAHQDRFTNPEAREITYIWLTPDMLKDEAAPDEAALRAAYEQRIAEYSQPERRLVDKLVFPTQEEAEAAKAQLDAGTTGFEDLARARGLELQDIDLGEVSKDELGTAGDAVFALTGPGVAGPIETALGPALYKMNGILPAENTTFEQARPDLETEATLDQARRMIREVSTDLEDRLASGATLEEVAQETRMEIGHIALRADTTEGIAAYQDFRDAANAVTDQDFPELASLDDGGVFALRLDGITPAAPIPFAEIRDRVATAWTADETTRLKTVRAEAVVAAVTAGTDLSDQGLLVSNIGALERTGYIEGAPSSLIGAAFAADPGTPGMVTDAGRVFVYVAGAPAQIAPDAPGVAQLRAGIEQRLGQTMANDLVTLYANAAQQDLGITLNNAAIAAVQAQMQ